MLDKILSFVEIKMHSITSEQNINKDFSGMKVFFSQVVTYLSGHDFVYF